MKSVTMATKREMSDYTVFFSVLGHKKFIHKILAKSESVRFQPLFKFFWCSQRIALKCAKFCYLRIEVSSSVGFLYQHVLNTLIPVWVGNVSISNQRISVQETLS